MAFSQILTQNLMQRRCSKWFIDYMEENKERLGVGRSWEAGDSRLLPSLQAGIILQALCFGENELGQLSLGLQVEERGWLLPLADSIGIELDSLGRTFQHRDPLLLVVKRNTSSISLIMPRFTYNRLLTKTVEVHITEARGVILWFWN